MIPCGRGDEFARSLLGYIFNVPLFLGTPIVIFVTMILMYLAVSKIEKNMQNYGVGNFA